MSPQATFIRWFSELGADNVPTVGGKNASLGEMYRALTPHGVHVPNGFAISADAYCRTLEQADALPRLRDVLDGLDVSHLTSGGACRTQSNRSRYCFDDPGEQGDVLGIRLASGQWIMIRAEGAIEFNPILVGEHLFGQR